MEVALSGGNIAQVHYCRHSAAEECGCRKPKLGLLRRAYLEHRFAPERTFFVSDSPGDCRAADDAGCRTILIERMSFLEERRAHEESPMVACNLYEAAEFIVAADHGLPREAAMAMQQKLQQGLQQGQI